MTKRARQVTQADYRAAGRGLARDAAEDIERGLLRPARMSFAEELAEAIGEFVNAKIEYARSPAEWANPETVNKTSERLETLLGKVRHV